MSGASGYVRTLRVVRTHNGERMLLPTGVRRRRIPLLGAPRLLYEGNPSCSSRSFRSFAARSPRCSRWSRSYRRVRHAHRGPSGSPRTPLRSALFLAGEGPLDHEGGPRMVTGVVPVLHKRPPIRRLARPRTRLRRAAGPSRGPTCCRPVRSLGRGDTDALAAHFPVELEDRCC
jgi:hypothetical protein